MKFRVLALIVLSACSVMAQDRFVYPAPDAAKIVARKGNVYRGESKFDLYRPAGDAIVPVVVFANVGAAPYQAWPGYIGWGQLTAASGLAAVLYEGTEDNPLAAFDALIGNLRQRANEFHVDPDRVVVWSGSSNVQIGLPIAMDRKRDYVRAAVVYYGAADVSEIRTDLPLMFVRAGLDGALNARIGPLLSRAIEANAPWTIENYAAGVHAFDIRDDNDISRELIDRTIRFMNSALRLSPTYAALGDRASVGGAFARGDWPVAIAGYRRFVAAQPGDGESHRRLGLALLQTNQYTEALRELEQAWELGQRGPRDTAYPAAKAAAGARNIERTVYWLDVVLKTRFGPTLEELRTSDAFAAVRDETAFRELLARFAAK